MCNSKLRKEFKIKIDISKLEKQMRTRDALAENPDIQPSIQCDKCHKWIKCNYYSGYSHRCSGRAEEIRRAAHKRFYSINSLQNRDARFFEMYNLADDLDSASIVYDPTANKLSRKDIEMNNQQENIERAIDSLFDDCLEEFRAEHPIDESFLTIYKDYKSIFVKEAAESADENMKIFDILLVYLYLCYNISTVCELKERNSEVKRSYVF